MGYPKQPGQDAEAHTALAYRTLEQARRIAELEAALAESNRRAASAEAAMVCDRVAFPLTSDAPTSELHSMRCKACAHRAKYKEATDADA